jgi:uncharacterized protein (DUF58 family)
MTKELNINFASALSQFARALKEFRVRNIVYRTVFRGKGLEFDSYRSFEPDEDSNMIDWKASLRGDKLLAKQYIEERNVDIYFAVDVSRSMLFGSGKKLKAEYAAELVLALGRLMIDSNDNIGLILFSNKVVKFLPPAKSKNQFFLFLKYLSDLTMYGGRANYREAFEQILRLAKSRSSVIILVSDFIGLKQGLERELRLLGAKYESIALMIRDPMDDILPNVKAQVVVQDPDTGEQLIIDPSLVSQRYNLNSGVQKKFVSQIFHYSRIDLKELSTNESFVLPIVSFLKSRAGGF